MSLIFLAFSLLSILDIFPSDQSKYIVDVILIEVFLINQFIWIRFYFIFIEFLLFWPFSFSLFSCLFSVFFFDSSFPFQFVNWTELLIKCWMLYWSYVIPFFRIIFLIFRVILQIITNCCEKNKKFLFFVSFYLFYIKNHKI